MILSQGNAWAPRNLNLFSGCFFTSSGGLRSFDCPIKELKPVPWTDSFGEVCGSTFEVDEESKKEIRVLRVKSATNWSQYSQKL